MPSFIQVWLKFIVIIWKALQHCSWTRDPSHYLTYSKTTKHPVNRRHLTFRWRRCSWSISGGCPPRWWTSSSRRRRRWVRGAGAAAGCWWAWARCSTAGCSRSRGCRSTRGPHSLATRLHMVFYILTMMKSYTISKYLFCRKYPSVPLLLLRLNCETNALYFTGMFWN